MTSETDLADALIRMFGGEAQRHARDNAASNARAGDNVSEKMWLRVAEAISARPLKKSAAK